MQLPLDQYVKHHALPDERVVCVSPWFVFRVMKDKSVLMYHDNRIEVVFTSLSREYIEALERETR